MDDVTLFMEAHGFQPKPKNFLETDLILGQQIDTGQFTLTYRQEDDRLILCDFATSAADGQAVTALIVLLRRVMQTVPTVRYIDAMIVREPRNLQLDARRERLASIMVGKGAKQVTVQGERWLRYVHGHAH